MIAVDNLPLSFTEKKGFQKLMNNLCPDYKLSSKTVIVNKIHKIYDSTRSKIQSELDSADTVALATDAWSSNSMKSFITVTAHVIDEKQEAKTFTLETKEQPKRHTAKYLRECFENSCENWKIDEKVTAVVHDNARPIVSAIENSAVADESVPCFAHTLRVSSKTY